MIARLHGVIDAVGPDHAVLDVNGVGYLVRCSAKTLAALPGKGEAATLATELLVREDAMELIGFTQAAERDWFRLLMSVQGVGARIALAILSALTLDELSRAIATGDRTMLTRAEGVGPKLASRLANELKDKVGAIAPVGAAGGALAAPPRNGAAADAISALTNLGYRRAEADGAVAAALQRLGDGAGVESLIASSLKELAR
jgi:Holliday junction DNA helicase RuvA